MSLSMLQRAFRNLTNGSFCNKIFSSFLNLEKSAIWYAVFFGLNLTLLFNPTKYVEVVKFDRTFGNGFINNWDISRLISNFMLWFFFFVVIFFLSWAFFSWFKRLKLKDDDLKIVSFIDNIIILGCVNLLLKAINFFSQNRQSLFLDYTSSLIWLVLFCGFLFFAISRISKNFSALYTSSDGFFQILTISFSLSFAFFVFCSRSEFSELLAIQIILFLLLLPTQIKIYRNKIIKSFVKSSAIVFSFVPISLSLYFEAINILNSNFIFVDFVMGFYAVLFASLVFSIIILARILKKRNITLDNWKQISFPILIVGLAMCSTQPALSMTYGADIFESANLSIPVSEFLNFGKLPIVNNYPGHMMSGVWQAYIYAFLNQDNFGAIVSPYYMWFEAPFLALMFFYFIKTIADEHVALFGVLLLPFASNWNYFGMGMLIILAVFFYFKKPSYKRAFLIYLAFIWCCVYRLDMGFAFVCATMATLVICIALDKNKENKKIMIKELSLSFLVTIFLCFVSWLILCFLQNVDPFLRLFEFIKLSSSNLTWAYGSIGNMQLNLFAWCYLLVPFFIAITLAVFILPTNLKPVVSIEIFILVCIFGLSYFFNFQRGLVRHSLVEMQNTPVLWSALLYIALFVVVFLKRNHLFLPFFVALILINSNFYKNTNFKESSMLERIVPKLLSNANESRSEKKERVQLRREMQKWVDQYQFVMDKILKKDETFVDFMNRSFVYSAIGRKLPVYVAQSPLMLSGEFTQKMFIKEILNNFEKIPVAILPLNNNRVAANLDGILNSYRYYLVSEFIFSNFKPMFIYGDFAVWVKNDKFDEILQKIQPFGFSVIGADYNTNFHSYNLAYLPLFWGEKDALHASQNKIVENLKEQNGYWRISQIKTKKKGNYMLLTVENLGKQGITSLDFGVLQDGHFAPQYKFTFHVLTGKHKYIFRISSDYLWFLKNINAVKLSHNFNKIDMKILEIER